MYIYLEGNIGSGKSTFVSLISKILNDCIFVQEPVDEWLKTKDNQGVNILDKFYSDTKKWAFPFQMCTYITRVQKISKIPQNKLAIIERSVYTDKNCFCKSLYESKQMDDIEWKLYNDWFGWLNNTFHTEPNGYIYLKTDPKICFKRIKKRSRNEETTISLDYLTNLHDKHEEWMNKQDIPVLTIDVSQDFEHNHGRLNKIISNVQEFIKNI